MKPLLFTLSLILLFRISDSFAQDKFEVKTTHPRVVLSKEAELLLRFLFLEDEDANNIKASLKANADKLLSEQFEIVDEKGNIKTDQAGELLHKVSTLGMAFRLFEENKYADKIVEYLVDVAQSPEWPQESKIELLTTSAIGYDWLYYDLSYEVREMVRNSIVKKALFPGLEEMKNAKEEENWIYQHPQIDVAYSGLLVLGALAVADNFPDLNKKIIYQFLINNQQKIETLKFDQIKKKYPDEWQDEVNYLAMSLSSIQYSLGHDFNISNLPSMKSFAADYLTYFSKGEVADLGEFDLMDPSFLWFDKLNTDKDIKNLYISNIKKYHLNADQNSRLNYICLLWMI